MDAVGRSASYDLMMYHSSAALQFLSNALRGRVKLFPLNRHAMVSDLLQGVVCGDAEGVRLWCASLTPWGGI